MKDKDMEDKSARILLDVPVDDGVLGFDNYRNALINIIKSSDPHFTIGIFGGWGTGKTSLMKMMEKELKAAGEITAWFNPWQYEKETHLVIPLVQTVNLELQTNHKDIVGEDTVRKITGLLRKVGRSMKPEVTIGIAKVGLDSEKLFEEEKENLTSLYFELNQELENVIRSIQNKQKQRIVIFIDDLDRCLPDQALQVLESIKGFLDVDGYVFVLGLSREIIERCVDKKYGKESAISGSEYLRKMIQVPFTLPVLREEEITEYVKNLKNRIKGSGVEEYLPDYLTAFAEGLEPNPREIKRLINSFIVANEISQEETEPAELLAMLIIQFRWESFYSELARHKKPFLEETAQMLRKKDELKNEEERKKARESWSFFDLVEGHLKDERLRNFLQGPGEILFEVKDLDPYLYLSKSVEPHSYVSDAADVEAERSTEQLIDLLRNGRIKQFNRVRPYPAVDLSFSGVILNLVGVDLRKINFSRAILIGANLRTAYLGEADLSNANLRGADLSGAFLFEADLSEAILAGAILSLATLNRANLDEALLAEADLRGTLLGHASLRDGFLRRADLTGAHLAGANLKGTDLTWADLRDIVVDNHTVFDGANISNVQNLSQEIRDQLHVEIVGGVIRATSKWLLEKGKPKGKT